LAQGHKHGLLIDVFLDGDFETSLAESQRNGPRVIDRIGERGVLIAPFPITNAKRCAFGTPKGGLFTTTKFRSTTGLGFSMPAPTCAKLVPVKPIANATTSSAAITFPISE